MSGNACTASTEAVTYSGYSTAFNACPSCTACVTFLPIALPEAIRSVFAQSITRGWFTAVLPVIGNPVFERLQMRSKLPNRSVKQIDNSIFHLLVYNSELSIDWQSEWCRLVIVLAFYDFGNVKLFMSLYLSSCENR